MQEWGKCTTGARASQYVLPNAGMSGWDAIAASIGSIYGFSSSYIPIAFVHSKSGDIRVNFYSTNGGAYSGSGMDIEMTVSVIYAKQQDIP